MRVGVADWIRKTLKVGTTRDQIVYSGTGKTKQIFVSLGNSFLTLSFISFAKMMTLNVLEIAARVQIVINMPLSIK